MRIILSLLLLLFILCPTFGGQQSTDNMSDEQYEAFLIKLLTPIQNGVQPKYDNGTEMTVQKIEDGVIVQPEETYKLKYIERFDNPWFRQPSLTNWDNVDSGELTISGRKIKTIRYKRTTHYSVNYVGPPWFEETTAVTVQDQLGTKNPVLLREQTDYSVSRLNGTYNGTNWWVVTGIVEKSIGDRKYVCAEIKERMESEPVGYWLTTEYDSPEIPSFWIEAIKEFHNESPKANTGIKSFVNIHKIINIRPPGKR